MSVTVVKLTAYWPLARLTSELYFENGLMKEALTHSTWVRMLSWFFRFDLPEVILHEEPVKTFLVGDVATML